MMRSMYSGVSGLKVHQTKMDVIGNNIANVNTIGFKASRVTFNEVMYQTTQNATGSNPETGAGGTNAMQIGLGTTVGSIYTDVTAEGSNQRTDNPFDMKLSGESFFIVQSGGMNYFTKVGAFTQDDAGNLVTQSGQKLMGWGLDENGNIKKDLVTPIQIETPENKYMPPEATSKAYLSGNIDKMAEGIASDGITVSYTIYDKQGYAYTVKMNLKQDAAKKEEYTLSVTDVLDSNNKSIVGTGTGDTAVALDPTDAKVVYDASSGNFVSAGGTGKTSVTLKLTNTAKNFNDDGISMDFSKTTMYASSNKTTLAAYAGDSDGAGKGKKVGEFTQVSIGTDGKIVATYDNGDTKLLGQIAVAQFDNPAGLEKIGDNLYQTTMNSGDFDGIGQDPTAGGGKLSSAVLEMSNVDLSNEFTEMITTQRGFQANSRIITTSDTLLEELVNLKR